MPIIDLSDLPAAMQSAELADLMVAGANARAARVAPCLVSTDPEPSEDQLAEARLILIGAISRWVQAGSGAFQQQTAGPFSVSTDTRQRSGYNLWPSEIEQLQAVCANGESVGRQAFSIDTAPSYSAHMPWCNLALGANWCSCGADLTAEEYPLYEGGVLSPGY